ncbi:MAG: hypothetical protein GX922_04805 [Firmicutes bacterium]|nr:hypothetical protein [Bacillota bacterium]
MTSILFILVLIAAGYFLVSRIKIRLSHTRVYIGIYMLLLMFAVAAFYYLGKTGSSLALENSEARESEFHRFLETGRVEHLKGIRKLGQWSFTYRGKELALKSTKDYFWTVVAIERKNASDETIEVISYTTGMQLKDADNPPGVKLKDGQLQLTNPPPVEIDLYATVADFTMTQFNAEKSVYNVDHSLAQNILGNQVLLVRIPAQLQLTVDETVSVIEQK